MDGTNEHFHRGARNARLLEAERHRAHAVRDAEIEYAETVLKLREAFEADVAAAARLRNSRVLPAHRAYNAAVVAAEQTYMVALMTMSTR